MTTTPDPVRTCVGCRKRRPTGELHRFQLHDGRLVPADPGRSAAPGGRGAWICRDQFALCLESAVRSRAFDRAFRTAVPSEAIDAARSETALSPTAVPETALSGTVPSDTDDVGGRLGNRR